MTEEVEPYKMPPDVIPYMGVIVAEIIAISLLIYWKGHDEKANKNFQTSKLKKQVINVNPNDTLITAYGTKYIVRSDSIIPYSEGK